MFFWKVEDLWHIPIKTSLNWATVYNETESVEKEL